jgi:hypothetical protein
MSVRVMINVGKGNRINLPTYICIEQIVHQTILIYTTYYTLLEEPGMFNTEDIDMSAFSVYFNITRIFQFFHGIPMSLYRNSLKAAGFMYSTVQVCTLQLLRIVFIIKIALKPAKAR